MKFKISFLSVVLLLFTAHGILAQESKDREAQAGVVPVIVTAPTLQKGPGSIFMVPIEVTDTTSRGVFGYRFELRFDKDIIVPVGTNFGCSVAGTLSGPESPTCNLFPDDETLTVFWFRAAPTMSGSGTLLNLQFQVVGTVPGSISPLQFVDFFFNEGSPSDLTVDGSVRVLGSTAAGTSVGGRVTSALGRPMANVRIVLTDNEGNSRAAISNAFGYYRIDDIPAGEMYFVSAGSKRYTFAPRTIFVGDEITDLDIVAEQ